MQQVLEDFRKFDHYKDETTEAGYKIGYELGMEYKYGQSDLSGPKNNLRIVEGDLGKIVKPDPGIWGKKR
ncbi:MAG: hypothetical protein KKE20_03370 [Nanoarchaeota archaeon]|nr:hypothetical protein [Nanoarchaeota archaeon]